MTSYCGLTPAGGSRSSRSMRRSARSRHCPRLRRRRTPGSPQTGYDRTRCAAAQLAVPGPCALARGEVVESPGLGRLRPEFDCPATNHDLGQSSSLELPANDVERRVELRLGCCPCSVVTFGIARNSWRSRNCSNAASLSWTSVSCTPSAVWVSNVSDQIVRRVAIGPQLALTCSRPSSSPGDSCSSRPSSRPPRGSSARVDISSGHPEMARSALRR